MSFNEKKNKNYRQKLNQRQIYYKKKLFFLN